jgi:hypothetical protein
MKLFSYKPTHFPSQSQYHSRFCSHHQFSLKIPASLELQGLLSDLQMLFLWYLEEERPLKRLLSFILYQRVSV